MADIKYHSIDPLILQTLNLNQRRMNHILDILHGRPEKQHPKTQRKMYNYSTVHYKQQPSTVKKQQPLPSILLNRKKNVEKSTQKQDPKTYRDLGTIKHKQRIATKQSYSLERMASNQALESAANDPIKKQHSAKKQKQSRRMDTIDQYILQQQMVRSQRQRKEQLMSDYMLDKLKRSKSQEINPKDIYRMEIEGLVAELTPIEEIEQAEKRMQRLKRRNKHLYSFDKNYYLKLNQHDLVVLS